MVDIIHECCFFREKEGGEIHREQFEAERDNLIKLIARREENRDETKHLQEEVDLEKGSVIHHLTELMIPQSA